MKIIDRIRDFFYDSVDYIFMLVIIVVVVGVIGWRLDILFAKDAMDMSGQNEVVIDNSNRDNEDPIVVVDDPTVVTEDPQSPTPTPPPTTNPPVTSSGEVVKVIIPEGSLPNKIGLILQEKGLVSSSRDFISKAVELHLDTKLKSGTFDIQKGLSLEAVVKIISRQN